MSRTAKLVLFVLLTLLALSGARAQLAVNPAPPHTPICIDKSDAYKLALADMQGTLPKTWEGFLKEGRCGFLPAQYLFTIDNYKDNTDVPSRVVELSFRGELVWGIRAGLPESGIWMISDDPAIHGNSGHDWYADAEITDAARKRFGYSWKKCCAQSEVFRTQFRVNKDSGDDEWYYQVPNGSWKLIPPDIIHWGESAPDGRPTLFIYQGVEVCFWPGEGGI